MQISVEQVKKMEVCRAIPHRYLAELAVSSRVVEAPIGTPVTEAGYRFGDSVYFILQGMVALFVPLKNGLLMPCIVLGPGKVIGLSRILGRVSTLDARPMIPCTLIAAPARPLRALLTADPVVAHGVYEELLQIQGERLLAALRMLSGEEVSFPTEQACPAGRPTHFLATSNTTTGEMKGMCHRNFDCSAEEGKGCPMAGKPAQEFHKIWPLSFPVKEAVGALPG